MSRQLKETEKEKETSSYDEEKDEFKNVFYRPSVNTANTPYVSAASTPTGANAGESSFVYLGGQIPIDASTLPNADLPTDPNMHDLEDVSNAFPKDGIFSGAYDDDVGAEANFNNMDPTIDVNPIPTLRIHKVHPKDQILGDPKSAVQTRGKIQKASSVQQALVSYIYNQNRTNHKDHQNCLFACFLSQEEPKNISQALQDESWVEAMQEELLQFKLQKVWVLVDLPYGKRLVAQGFRQEEGIDYDEVFAPVARIEAIRLFLAFASYMGFTVYQMDVKSAFLYGTIGEEVYVQQPLGFVDPAHPNKVYKVIKALYGLHQAPRAWYKTLSTFLLENGFRRGTIDKTLFIKKNKSDIMLVQVYVDDIIFGSTRQSMCTEFEDCMHKRFQMRSMGKLTFFLGLQVQQQPDGIFISQDKYVADILKKFDFCSIRTATTPIESNKPLVQDEDGVDVDVHVYRSMIGSLMYLTASRPDIMFAVCACARFQVTPKASHLNAVKRIFRYLKHQPKLGLWYPRDSPFELEAFSDSDYGGASLDRKSTTGGCQFLGRRLISWQCKKQTIVANSTTEAEYVAAANCCGQVLWIQNQMMDYGFNFMNTKIHIDNESTICIVKNPVYHSRTKHIEIRHHFIRDCYEKRLIDVVKIHTDNNVADLLTKGFDVTRFNFLVLELILLGNNMDLRMDGSCASNFSHIWVLVLRVKKLEYKLKFGKARRKAKIVLSNDEEIVEDSSKQGRKISQIDEDPTVSLVQDEDSHCNLEENMEVGKGGVQGIKEQGHYEEPATPKRLRTRTQVLLSWDEELARKVGSEVEKDSSKPSERETSKTIEEEKVEEGDFPIVDWESQSLGNMHAYKIIRADGNTSYHKTFEKGFNLMLWGDLKILVDPEQDDDIWKNQNPVKNNQLEAV
ncbi:putative ribonuclease H-like domain-containing protein [Tanacetum coccineum]